MPLVPPVPYTSVMRAFFTLLSASWRYAKGRRFWLVVYMLMFLAANVLLLVEPWAIGKLLNAVQNVATTPDPAGTMLYYFLLMVLIPVGFWILHGPARTFENNIAFHAQTKFRNHLFAIVTSLPIQWHKDHHSGQTINKINKSTRALFDFMANGYNFIEMFVKLFGSVVVLWLLLPFASLIAMLVSIGALAIVFVFDLFLVKSYDAINEREHFVASALHDYITNIRTVISLRLEKLTQAELWQRMTSYFPLYRRTNIANEWKWFLTTFVISVMTVVVLAWYALGQLSAGNVLLAGTFFMLYDYLQKIGSAFYTFAWKYSNTVQQYADLSTAQTILRAGRAQKDEGLCLPKHWKRIDIRRLQFSYEDEEKKKHHLRDINLILEKGKRIALVGESGSGKSTLMSLIRGLHTTESVTVLVDGKELKKGLRCISSHVTLIPQEPEIFANTIEYNITVDTQQAKKEILKYVDLARFTTVLERLEKGLKTDIAEKGVNLSGGEKQRLALARGIFAAEESDIILLDEPTSSVDSANELEIHKNIFGHFRDRCIVSSIHRLHLLPLFDEVYVLEKGQIIEQGKPEALMHGQGLLSRLWKTYNESKKESKTPVDSL